MIRRHFDSDKRKKVLSPFDLQINGYPQIDAKVVKVESCDIVAEAFVFLVTYAGSTDILAMDITDLSEALTLKL